MAVRPAARSATVRVARPMLMKFENCSTAVSFGIRPSVGFRPSTPQALAGMRDEPAPSVVTASGPMPAATATAPPPLDPPGDRAVSQGLRVKP